MNNDEQDKTLPAEKSNSEPKQKSDSDQDTMHVSSSEGMLLQAPEVPVECWERYEFIEFIGEGGMGSVYKARDPRLNRIVALKFLRGDDSRLVHRFMQEAIAQARVEHENVCKIFEVGDVRGNLYIAMQFIDGIPLKKACSLLTLAKKVQVMIQVAEGMQAAHRSGLIHRDIKPDNIMLEQTPEEKWHPYIMDFGLAREQSTPGITVSGMIMGTPAYMSPEQARGEVRTLDSRTDIFSYGATMYELLCGQAPFAGESTIEIMRKTIPKRSIKRRRHMRNCHGCMKQKNLRAIYRLYSGMNNAKKVVMIMHSSTIRKQEMPIKRLWRWGGAMLNVMKASASLSW
ncbi:MAG: hypothetical protein A2Y62_19515 [Candidatus Fischerbacteria bacterium RBG_13_37_8]|uniref:Protein kinase domain-containing protein n=1 Tax=Candidatus Fischerbacteria bacterium RBG_13_37_8 TaxID=1817863 RepID=A0A1F5VXM7_9BACT|nr:MAG: hypothetical protein A2Y62_19515 [Candidatus Fischerbacteria bacterium RBG_13_37_8]